MSLRGRVGVGLDPPHTALLNLGLCIPPLLLLPARSEPCGVEMGPREMRTPKREPEALNENPAQGGIPEHKHQVLAPDSQQRDSGGATKPQQKRIKDKIFLYGRIL